MDNVINIRPPDPPKAKQKRKPLERFSSVRDVLGEHQSRVYEACALLGAVTTRTHYGSGEIRDDERVRLVCALDGVLRLLSPVAYIDSFSDLVKQGENSREAKEIETRW